MNIFITVSIQRTRIPLSGSLIKRWTFSGIKITEFIISLVAEYNSKNTPFPPFWIKGNGWDGSRVVGAKSGSIFISYQFLSHLISLGDKSSSWVKNIPSLEQSSKIELSCLSCLICF